VLTTLVGGIALLCAKHPVMFSVGMTLTVGIFVGYVSSFIVIPSMYKAVKG
jgi:predicted RND superfamily exporter protein